MMDVSGWVKNSAECYLPEKCSFGQTLQPWYHEVLQVACRPSNVCGSFHGVRYSQRRRYPSIFHSHPLSLWLIPNPSKVLKVDLFSRLLSGASNSKEVITDQNESCEQSPVQQNVTLRGGINAGTFKKLAQYVAMQLCIRMCCEEKGCDVALMSGKNCYGIQCYSEELCRAVPAKKAPSSLMISHVTIKGEGGKWGPRTPLLKHCEQKLEPSHRKTLQA